MKFGTIGLGGVYGIVVRKATTGIIVQECLGVDSRGIPNDITNIGLNRIGTSRAISACFLGTGSSTPTTTDTQMGSYGTYTTGSSPNIPNNPAPTSPNYISTKNYGWRFSPGTATGTWTEVGVGWFEGAENATNHRIWSRVKIVDGLGAPTTITLLADEVLDVFYSLKASMPLVDGSGTINISGASYNYSSRMSSAPNTILSSGEVVVPPVQVDAYSGLMGPITGNPSTSIGSSSDIIPTPYVDLSRACKFTAIWGLPAANSVSGIKSMVLMYAGTRFIENRTQFEFDNPIPKDNTKVLSLEFSFSWDRA